MPRVSIRKVFIYLLGATSFVLLLMNIHQTMVGSSYSWPGMTGLGSGPGPGGTGLSASGTGSGPSGPNQSGGRASGTGLRGEKGDSKRDSGSNNDKVPQQQPPVAQPKIVQTQSDGGEAKDANPNLLPQPDPESEPIPRKTLDRSRPLFPNDTHVPVGAERPWFMPGGKTLPKQCPVDANGRRATQLLPEETPGYDRVTEQLMYYPPKGVLPEDISSPSTPLKKILLWNGINSWGGARPGRGTFLKMECPVSSCALTTSRMDSTSADLVIFKDHFTNPTYKRPANQLWMIYMLECPLHTQMFKVRTESHILLSSFQGRRQSHSSFFARTFFILPFALFCFWHSKHEMGISGRAFYGH